MVTRRAAAGFTLIELMIVIAIVGLMLVLGAPLTRAWVVSTQLHDAQAQIGQAYARGKAMALRNPGGVSDSLAATIVCLSGTTLSLYAASDSNTAAACSGTATWSTEIADSVSVQAPSGTAFTCVAFDNRSRAISASASDGGNSCSTGNGFTLTKESGTVTAAYY
ncbi:pilus assembly FimT family protein [Solimonas marina]|uniref:Prepilin-type N-terminal cleavage/methylation domain-containing protein n=1 Tax=Solimonas marina TaxID=2714601 RepID=A0A970B3F2_9GAMM|nr:prepilin-type N-terminal cleavage/methylation domain-containing protein [Solimonas marina]NKF21172.1 prepilin-type N-terminal cleavage/methylation domain-containing protein [Solimonas marina]